MRVKLRALAVAGAVAALAMRSVRAQQNGSLMGSESASGATTTAIQPIETPATEPLGAEASVPVTSVSTFSAETPGPAATESAASMERTTTPEVVAAEPTTVPATLLGTVSSVAVIPEPTPAPTMAELTPVANAFDSTAPTTGSPESPPTTLEVTPTPTALELEQTPAPTTFESTPGPTATRTNLTILQTTPEPAPQSSEPSPTMSEPIVTTEAPTLPPATPQPSPKAASEELFPAGTLSPDPSMPGPTPAFSDEAKSSTGPSTWTPTDAPSPLPESSDSVARDSAAEASVVPAVTPEPLNAPTAPPDTSAIELAIPTPDASSADPSTFTPVIVTDSPVVDGTLSSHEPVAESTPQPLVIDSPPSELPLSVTIPPTLADIIATVLPQPALTDSPLPEPKTIASETTAPGPSPTILLREDPPTSSPPAPALETPVSLEAPISVVPVAVEPITVSPVTEVPSPSPVLAILPQDTQPPDTQAPVSVIVEESPPPVLPTMSPPQQTTDPPALLAPEEPMGTVQAPIDTIPPPPVDISTYPPESTTPPDAVTAQPVDVTPPSSVELPLVETSKPTDDVFLDETSHSPEFSLIPIIESPAHPVVPQPDPPSSTQGFAGSGSGSEAEHAANSTSSKKKISGSLAAAYANPLAPEIAYTPPSAGSPGESGGVEGVGDGGHISAPYDFNLYNRAQAPIPRPSTTGSSSSQSKAKESDDALTAVNALMDGDPSRDPTDFNSALIIGLVGGCVMIIVVLLSVEVYLRRSRRKHLKMCEMQQPIIVL